VITLLVMASTTVRRRSRTSAAEVVDILLSSTSDADFDAFLARTAAGPRPGDRDESSQTPTSSPRFESSPAVDTAASRMGKLQGEQGDFATELYFANFPDAPPPIDSEVLQNLSFNEPLRCNPARSRESTRTMSEERQARSTLRPTTRRQTARSAHSCAAVFEGEGEDEGDLLQSQSERSGRDGRALSMPSPALRAVDEPRRNKRTGVSFCEYDLVWNFA
jgi:hypothetical protein